MQPDQPSTTKHGQAANVTSLSAGVLAVVVAAAAGFAFIGGRAYEHTHHSAVQHASRPLPFLLSHRPTSPLGKNVIKLAPHPLRALVPPRATFRVSLQAPRHRSEPTVTRKMPHRRIATLLHYPIVQPARMHLHRSSGQQRAYLTLVVNGTDEGEALVIFRNGDILLPLAALQRAGVHLSATASDMIDGQAYILGRSLSPGISFVFDEQSLSLRLQASPQYFGSKVIALSNNRPPNIVYSKATSGFLNYALDWHDFKQLNEYSELGFSSNGNLYYSGLSVEPGGKLLRGLTNATFDNPALMKRWVVGDTFADGGQLGGNTFLGGISVSRNFSLNPYFVRYPGVGLSGQTLTPSTAEIYVNGYLVGTQQLPPGKFDITNIPVVAGGGTAQVVIQDAFGHTQTLSSSYYYSTAVLQRGLCEYSYNLGAQRTNVGSSGGTYGPVIFIGSDRVGITDWFTAGGRLDAGPGLVSGGPSASVRLGAGQLGLNAALSHAGGVGGGAAELDYAYLNRYLSYGAGMTSMSAHYATASLSPAQDRATFSANAFAGFELGSRTSVTVVYTTSAFRDSPSVGQLSLDGAVRLSSQFDLIASAGRSYTAATPNDNQYSLALSYQLGRNTLAAVAQQGGSVGSGSGLSVQQSLPLGTGVGYRFSHGTGSELTDDDVFQYQGSTGLYQASYLQAGGVSGNDLSAAGGLVDARDGIMFTRAVEDGFAVIDVPNLPGVRGYYNNQLVGRTDAEGRLFVPNLLSYYGNMLQISDQDIPLDYSIDDTEQTVAPPYRGGALVTFGVQKVSAITGKLVVDEMHKSSVPSFGELRVNVNGHFLTSEIGRRGEFYVEDLAPGGYPARVEYANGACAFQLVVPKSESAITDVGPVHCTRTQIIGSTP